MAIMRGYQSRAQPPPSPRIRLPHYCFAAARALARAAFAAMRMLPMPRVNRFSARSGVTLACRCRRDGIDVIISRRRSSRAPMSLATADGDRFSEADIY